MTQGNLAFLNRQNYSFPPDHGARVVTTILNDPALRADWQAELEDMRARACWACANSLAGSCARSTGSDRFDFIAQHRGMFSRLGATPEQVERLRAEHGIYMVGDSRLEYRRAECGHGAGAGAGDRWQSVSDSRCDA